MAQLTGSGAGHGTNYAMVDSSVGTDVGRLWTNTAISGIPIVDVSGVTHTSGTTQIYAGARGPMNLDTATNALVTITYEHHEIHDGSHYNIRGFSSPLASGARLSFGVAVPAGSKWPHLLFDVEGTTQTEVREYEGATLSGGTLVTAYNNNRNSTNVSSLVIRSNPVISGTSPTSGTLLASHSKGLAGTTPSKASAIGEIDRTDELILKSGTTYLYEIKSVGASNIIDYSATWYEHTDKVKQF